MPQQDPFVGTWKMNLQESSFETSHRPSQGTMRFERKLDGYILRAEGVCEGKYIKEQPVRFIFDGKEHPVPGAPKITAISTRPDANTVLVEARRGGRIAGEASYLVSADGATLTTRVRGIDDQQRPFRTTVVWVRD
jgi:hypothetical protein